MSQLKEDLAGQEVDDEGHEEEEEPQEESRSAQTHTFEEQGTCVKHSHLQKTVFIFCLDDFLFSFLRGPADDEAQDEPITELRTVRQQLALIRKRRQTNASYGVHCPEPFTLKLSAQQKQRLEQQLQQV